MGMLGEPALGEADDLGLLLIGDGVEAFAGGERRVSSLRRRRAYCRGAR
jgi:hypothetical protein